MNILYICADKGIPILGHKGASIHVRSLSEAFVRMGHTVTIVAPTLTKQRKADPNFKLVYPQGVLVERVKFQTALDPALTLEEAQEQRAIAYSDTLFDALVDTISDYDLVYERYSLWSDVGAHLAQVGQLPFVLEVNAPLRQEALQFRKVYARDAAEQIEQTQFSMADRIAVVSAELRDYVVAHGGNALTTDVLPNAVDPQRFHPVVGGKAIRQRYGLENKQVIGFVGRVRPWHDIGTLLNAFTQLWTANAQRHLLIVGQTDPTVAEQVNALGLADAVTLTGPVPHPDIPAHIAAMDVAVSSHIDSADSYFSPLKLYEYLACGVPTVAANVGQTARLITDGNTGYLYQPGSIKSLTQAIDHILEQPQEARQAAWRGARLILENYTWDGNAARVLESFTQVTPTLSKLLPLLDNRLHRRLYRATRADLALAHLPHKLDGLRLTHIDHIDLLKYKPNRRCVLGYAIQGYNKRTGVNGRINVIGKLFRDKRGERLNVWQSLLWTHGFGPEAEDQIKVAAALGYVPKMHMQLQEWADGQTFDELAATCSADDSLVWEAARAAEALAKLHQWRVPDEAPPLGQYHLQDEIANLPQFARRTTELRPDLQPAVDEMLQQLQAWAKELPAPMQSAVLHRDFYYSQLLFAEDTVTLIDFDLITSGDPAIDVANFIVHLKLLGVVYRDDVDGFSAEANAFLDAYQQHAWADSTFLMRLAFYQATTSFRLLHVVLTRPHYHDKFEAFYQSALLTLARETRLVA